MDYLKVPFADKGDRLPVPRNPASVKNGVNFTQGFTLSYELSPTVEGSLDISREDLNYLFYTVTKGLIFLQEQGVPDWITPVMNEGVDFHYPAGCLVHHLNTVWLSLEANTSEPGKDGKWFNLIQGGAIASDKQAGQVRVVNTISDKPLDEKGGAPIVVTHNAVQSALSKLGTVITEIQKNLGSVGTTVTGIQKVLGTATSDITQIKKDIEGLSKKLDPVGNNIVELNKNITSVNERLQSSVTDLQNKINALHALATQSTPGLVRIAQQVKDNQVNDPAMAVSHDAVLEKLKKYPTIPEVNSLLGMQRVNYWGDDTYLPVDISGSFEGASPSGLWPWGEDWPWCAVVPLIEYNGNLMWLRPGTNGSTRGVYYCWQDAPETSDFSNFIQTQTVYQPTYLQGNRALGLVSSDGQVLYGCYGEGRHIKGWFIGLTYNTYDHVQHRGCLIPRIGSGSNMYVCRFKDMVYAFINRDYRYKGNELSVYGCTVESIESGNATFTEITGWNGVAGPIKMADQLFGSAQTTKSCIWKSDYPVPDPAVSFGSRYGIRTTFMHHFQNGVFRLQLQMAAYDGESAISLPGRTMSAMFTLDIDFANKKWTTSAKLPYEYHLDGSLTPKPHYQFGYPSPGGVYLDCWQSGTWYLGKKVGYFLRSSYCGTIPYLGRVEYDDPMDFVSDLKVKACAVFNLYNLYGSNIGCRIHCASPISDTVWVVNQYGRYQDHKDSYPVRVGIENKVEWKYSSLYNDSLNGFKPTLDRTPCSAELLGNVTLLRNNTVSVYGGSFTTYRRATFEKLVDEKPTGRIQCDWNAVRQVITSQVPSALAYQCEFFYSQFEGLPSVVHGLAFFYDRVEKFAATVTTKVVNGNIVPEFQTLICHYTEAHRGNGYNGSIAKNCNDGGYYWGFTGVVGVAILDTGDGYVVGLNTGCNYPTPGGGGRGHGLLLKVSGNKVLDYTWVSNYPCVDVGWYWSVCKDRGLGYIPLSETTSDIGCKVIYVPKVFKLSDFDVVKQEVGTNFDWRNGAINSSAVVILSQDVAEGFVVYVGKSPSMVGGIYQIIPQQMIDLHDVTANPANSTFYCYVVAEIGELHYRITLRPMVSSPSVFFIGTIKTNGNQISEIKVSKEYRLNGYYISEKSRGKSLVAGTGEPTGAGSLIGWGVN